MAELVLPVLVFFGCYSVPDQHEIFCYRFDPSTQSLTRINSADLQNASYLTISADGKYLYAVSEVGKYEGESSGAVAAFSLDTATGSMKLLNKVATHAAGSCHLTLSHDGKTLIVANYSGGAASIFPVKEDGSLEEASQVLRYEGKGPYPGRQDRPHAHSAFLDPSGQFAYIQDLGTDKVMQYALTTGKLEPLATPSISMKPGAGPRHLVFHPPLPMAYIINELDNTVTRTDLDITTGELTAAESYPTLPEDFTAKSTTADIHITPDGKYLYASNRGHDSLAAYAIDSETGKLTFIDYTPVGGKTPRSFAISPDGKVIIVTLQDSSAVTTFAIDSATGKLKQLDLGLELPRPVCVRFF